MTERGEFQEEHLQFATNLVLDMVVDTVRRQIPNWEEIVSKLLALKLHISAGPLLEVHLRALLEQFAEENPGMVVLNPIPHGTETENFRFVREKNDNVRVINLKTGKDHTEYDALTVIDGLPTLWEAKLLGSNEKTAGRIYDSCTPNRNEKRFRPLIEYYGRRPFGFAVVCDPQVTESALGNFIRLGGQIVHLPVRGMEFHMRASQVE